MAGIDTRAVVLAAGRSTRFKTKKSKLLFSICGQPMILYPLRALASLNIPTSLVLGYQADSVWSEIQHSGINNITPIIQKEQLGTGHAVACTQHTWDANDILIMYGDMPLMTKELLEQLIKEHKERQATISFFTAFVIDPTGYGRVVEHDGKMRIVEEKDCTPEERHINRINAGVYMMNRAFVEKHINNLGKSSVTGEIYLPELIRLASEADLTVNAIPVPYDNVRGVNTLQELWNAEQIKRSECIKHWMANGVRFELAQGIHIDINVEIGAGSFIGTGVHLLGNTKIGEECTISAFSIIEDSIIGDNTLVHSHTVIQGSTLGTNVKIGPFARLRENAVLGDDVLIGNFVEIKNTKLGNTSQTKHLSYLGDSIIGTNVNVGAGTITCNYDGVKKNTTVIGDNAFIGSNNTMIAPVTIGAGAYTAAGSTITDDVPAEALAIARNKQTNKIGYARKLREAQSQSVEKKHHEKFTKFFNDDEKEETQFNAALKTQPHNT